MRKARILVIEQNKEMLKFIIGILSDQAEFEITTARDTLEGLRNVFESCPDIVIMGSGLSPVSGTAVQMIVRQVSYIPIIMFGDESDCVDSLEEGADAFLSNPIKPLELVARVHRLMDRKMKLVNPGTDFNLKDK